jgi:hypothetical protein
VGLAVRSLRRCRFAYIYEKFEPAVIRNLLAQLTTDNVVMMVTSREYAKARPLTRTFCGFDQSPDLSTSTIRTQPNHYRVRLSKCAAGCRR